MKKISLLTCALLTFFLSQTYAQFSFSGGLGLFMAGGKAEKDAGESMKLNYGITAALRYNITEQETSSVSIDAPISLGVTGTYNSRVGASSNSSFLFNAPLVLNYNTGCGSTSDNTEGVGFFGGAGYGYHVGASVFSGSASASGPLVNAGIRFGVHFWGEGQVISLRGSYMMGLNTNKTNVIGINLLLR